MADYDPTSTLKSIASMLGWMNVPPRETFEAEIRAMRANEARLKRHVSTLCALLNGVAVNAQLDERCREIRDTIKKEIGE